MQVFLYLVLVLLFAAAAALATAKYRLSRVKDRRNLADSIDKEVNRFLAKKPPSAVVVGVYKDGRIRIKGYGPQNANEPLIPDKSTVFQIGSLSKLITCAALQRMADDGSVELDANLKELIGDRYELSPRVEAITLRQLAAHTSGFPRVPDVLLKKIRETVGKENIMVNPYSHLDLTDIMQYLKSPDGLKPPGKFSYSNYGLGLLGHVLEIVSDQTLETLAIEKVLKPLEMKNTGITIKTEIKQAMINGYTSKGLNTPLWTFGALGGAGAFYSTMHDLMQFIISHMSDKSPTSKSLIDMLFKSEIGWMQAGIFERFFGNNGFFWHDGMVGGYSSYMALDPRKRTGVAILTNNASDVSFLGALLVLQARTQSWTDTIDG